MSGLTINWPPPAAGLMPKLSGVHVWAVPLIPTSAGNVGYAEVLSPEERERAAAYRLPGPRQRFIIARGALRRLLGGYLQCEPAALEFDYGARGKPELRGQGATPIHFNVAHSHDLALIAVTRAAPVGVDVELIRPMRDADRIAERYFSPREAEALRHASAADRAALFFVLWTRKEAWLKATGQGISESLSKFEVTFLPQQPPCVVAVAGDAAAGAAWRLCNLDPADGYAGALAVQVGELTLQCWQLTP